MASVSASHLILFIASMVVAASVAGVFTNTVGSISESVSDQGLDLSNDIRTDVEVISDAGSAAVYNDTGAENVTLHVKNTGSNTLPATAGSVDLFVDGQYETDVELTLLGSASDWRPDTVVKLEISRSLSAGDHRVKVIVNGDEEVFEFRT